jgi:hypothetical protein
MEGLVVALQHAVATDIRIIFMSTLSMSGTRNCASLAFE